MACIFLRTIPPIAYPSRLIGILVGNAVLLDGGPSKICCAPLCKVLLLWLLLSVSVMLRWTEFMLSCCFECSEEREDDFDICTMAEWVVLRKSCTILWFCFRNDSICSIKFYDSVLARL